MHGIDCNRAVHFYTDASGFAGGLAVTWFQAPQDVDTHGTIPVEVPIVYDSFTFARTRRGYHTYKRELYVIVEFVRKYDYLCKYLNHATVVHTDRKLLTYFMGADSYEGIYRHWANQPRRLNVKITYIPGPRNKVADALSRTLFDEGYSESKHVLEACGRLSQEGPAWVWKDGKNGYEDFLQQKKRTASLAELEERAVRLYHHPDPDIHMTICGAERVHLGPNWRGGIQTVSLAKRKSTASLAE